MFITVVVGIKNVHASNSIKARIGNQYFDSLEEAIIAASSTDIITLTSNTTVDETLIINKNVNINLNNFNIQAEEKVFLIQGGSLNLSGNGKISETKPNYGAITLIGSDDPTKKDFSTVSVGSGITLEGWSGIFINHNNKTGYGILVNMNGSINAADDTNGDAGAGIYVNGNIKHLNNAPIINLSDTSKITSSGSGIYSAGYANYYINGAYINGKESGLAIKSGYFNIWDGTIIGSGEDKTPTTGNNNGINPSGTAIQIESNPGYAGNIELYIKDGSITSQNSNVIYEYTVNGDETEVREISLTGGEYVSKANKPVFLISESMKQSYQGFISGGEYSSDPSEFLKNGYNATKNKNDMYEVANNTTGVFGMKENSNNPFTVITIAILVLIIGITIFSNRERLLRVFNKIKK